MHVYFTGAGRLTVYINKYIEFKPQANVSNFPDWCDCLIVECIEIMTSFFSIQDKEKVRFEMTHEELYSFYNQVRLEYMYLNTIYR